MIKIAEASGVLLDKAEELIKKTFPWMSLLERMSFWAYRRQHNPLVRLLMRLSGVSSLSNTWVAINEDEEVCGTIGLYVYSKDKSEASWLSWFCVDEEQRGKGIGKILLEFSISEAKRSGKRFLRLYTSDDPSEATAQELYEKYGFKIFKQVKYTYGVYLYRELKLH